jgi:hypothetical protein
MYSPGRLFNQLTTVFTSLVLSLGLLIMTGVVSAQYSYDQFDNDVKQCMTKRDNCSKSCSNQHKNNDVQAKQCIIQCSNQEQQCIGQLEKKLDR